MPIYEYECRKCKAHIEAFQKVSDKPLTKCRKCGGRLDKRISAPAIQFKGSGWYVTDYAGKATKNEASESQTTSETAAKDKTVRLTRRVLRKAPPSKKTDKPSAPKPSSGD